jgi:hypothetical protein
VALVFACEQTARSALVSVAKVKPAVAIPILLCGALLLLPAAQSQDAASLKAHHVALDAALARNAFRRPIVLTSAERADRIEGDIYARVEQPFGVVGPALQGIEQWCHILILHLNVKQCRGGAGRTLDLVVGHKHDQAFATAYRLRFTYEVADARPDYLRVVLHAAQGPLGTHGYRIVLEGAALDARRSFLHLSYAYGYGGVAHLAMQAYLATVGRDKVGFSIVGRQADGGPSYISGTRGVVERNTMRYYLAIEAYLGALALPAEQQLEKRLAAWHAGVEGYPRQLHDLERGEYLELKRRQVHNLPEPGG